MTAETPGAPAQGALASRTLTITIFSGIMLVLVFVCGLLIWTAQTNANADTAIENAYNVRIVAHGKDQTIVVRNASRSIQCDTPVDLKKPMNCADSVQIAAANP